MEKLKANTKIKPSGTISVYERVQLLRNEGKNIVILAVGELDVYSPDSAKNAGIEAIKKNFTRYTTTDGIPELRSEVAAHISRQTGQKFGENNILIANGCKQATFNILISILKKGEQVIIPSPYYTSHPIQVELAGGKPVFVKTTDTEQFQLNEKALQKEVNPKTRALLVTSPQNPTGAIYSLKSIKILADFVTKNDLWLISDEIYSDIVYPPQQFESILKHHPKLKKRLIIVNGFSKSYAMTGWRIGYAAGPEEIIKLASNVHANTTSNVCSISQKAALAALTKEPEFPKTFMKELSAKRSLAVKTLSTVRGIQCHHPQGAFYLFPNVRKFYGKKFNSKALNSSAEIADYLMLEHGVAIVPGEAFGAPGHIRISFAVDMKTLETGLSRIKKGLEQLK